MSKWQIDIKTQDLFSVSRVSRVSSVFLPPSEIKIRKKNFPKERLEENLIYLFPSFLGEVFFFFKKRVYS